MRRSAFSSRASAERVNDESTPDDLRTHCGVVVERGPRATAICVRDMVKRNPRATDCDRSCLGTCDRLKASQTLKLYHSNRKAEKNAGRICNDQRANC